MSLVQIRWSFPMPEMSKRPRGVGGGRARVKSSCDLGVLQQFRDSDCPFA